MLESARAPQIAASVLRERGTSSIRSLCWFSSKMACASLPTCNIELGPTNFLLRPPRRSLRSLTHFPSLTLPRSAPMTTIDSMSTVIGQWLASFNKQERLGSLPSASTEFNASLASSTRRKSRQRRPRKNLARLQHLPNRNKIRLQLPRQRARRSLRRKQGRKRAWSNRCSLTIASSR